MIVPRFERRQKCTTVIPMPAGSPSEGCQYIVEGILLLNGKPVNNILLPGDMIGFSHIGTPAVDAAYAPHSA